MVSQVNGLNPDIINKYQGVVSKPVLSAIAAASRETGADFAYLMDKAATESGFDPKAKSKGSTATGLFQFIEKTWLTMIANHGAEHGLDHLARQISLDEQGRPQVADPALRRQILDLRKDPRIAAAMAGEFAVDNKEYLQGRLKKAVGSAELYLAHFLGAGRAATFLRAMGQNPQQIAANVFGTEATANKNVFFDKATGRPRTLEQVYAFFDKKFEAGNETTAVAGKMTAPSPAPAADSLAALDDTTRPIPLYRPAASIPGLYRTLDPVSIMMMAETADTLSDTLQPQAPRERRNRNGFGEEQRTAGWA